MNLKETIKISAIIGLIEGVLALIPYFTFIMFLVLFFLTSIIFGIYKKPNLKDFDNQKTAFYGFVIGGAGSIGFFIVFVPMVLILSFIFKNYLSFGLTYLIKFDAMFFMVLILFLVMLTIALTNTVGFMIYKGFKEIDWKEYIGK